MKWIVIILIAIVAIIALIYMIGYFMPVKHQSTIVTEFETSPAHAWSLITDYKSYSSWRRGLKNVIPIDATHWTEVSANGTIHYEGEVLRPNEVFVIHITNKDLPFGGYWNFHLKPLGNITELTITEHGEVYNPVFRFMSKYVFGYDATLRQYASDLSNYINKR